MTDFEAVLEALEQAGVKYIVIGGFAASVHGSPRLTQDLDVVYARDPVNIERLVAALQPLGPYLRGAPPGLPFRLDVETVLAGLNFTLTTSAGDVDVLGEVAGGRYPDLLADTEELEVFGRRCRFVTLERLVALKRAAGRPKDLEAIAELEALGEERKRRSLGDS